MNTENNKIIAEFMGAEIEGLNYRVIAYDDIKVCMHPNKLNYHKDWNWLMEVVEKIESLGYWQEITFNYVVSQPTSKTTKANSKIEAVYNACLEFIKLYNKQNQ